MLARLGSKNKFASWISPPDFHDLHMETKRIVGGDALPSAPTAEDGGTPTDGQAEVQSPDDGVDFFSNLRPATRQDYYNTAWSFGDKKLLAFLDANPDWQP